MKELRHLLLVILGVLSIASCSPPDARVDVYDVAIVNGRIMDPNSGTDALLNIGIRDGRIEWIGAAEVDAKRTVNAGGLVVAPGFVDLHAHGQTDEAFRLMVQDGVTSAFELEVGTADVDGWYAEREGGQLLNYGVSIGHIPVRMQVMDDEGGFLPSGPGGSAVATDEQIETMRQMIQRGLDAGAVAVGFGLAYTPAATREEFATMMRLVAINGTTAHIHVRDGVAGVVEAMDVARDTGAALHVVHANSSGGEAIADFLAAIEDARAEGRDVSTEAYPYEAGMTSIQSALFDDWESWDDDRFPMHQWAETGERLTRESFGKYRRQGGLVAIHSRTEAMTRVAIGHPLTMIASDGLIAGGKGHPRTSGTYSRVLGKYVREQGTLPLMDALAEMTIMPAQRLADHVPAMRDKGRIAVGADADITVFDPRRVIDRATYTEPTLTSVGIEYVLVNGELVVEGGTLIPDVLAGRAVRIQ